MLLLQNFEVAINFLLKKSLNYEKNDQCCIVITIDNIQNIILLLLLWPTVDIVVDSIIQFVFNKYL